MQNKFNQIEQHFRSTKLRTAFLDCSAIERNLPGFQAVIINNLLSLRWRVEKSLHSFDGHQRFAPNLDSLTRLKSKVRIQLKIGISQQHCVCSPNSRNLKYFGYSIDIIRGIALVLSPMNRLIPDRF